MRRIGLGRCARRGGDSAEQVDLEEIRRADEELDALAARESAHSDDSVLRLLGALASDVDDDAPPQPKSPPKRRRMISRAALTTGLTIAALSGTGMAAATVMVGGVGALGPIHQAVEALYDVDADPRISASPRVSSDGVRGTIDRTRDAIDDGRLGDAQQLLQQARSDWQRMDGPTAGLGNTIDDLEDRLAGGNRPDDTERYPLTAPSDSPDGGGGSGATATATATDEEPTEDATTASNGDDPTPSPTPSDSPTPSPEPSPTGSPDDDQSDGPSGTDGGSSDSTTDPGDGSTEGTTDPGGGSADSTTDTDGSNTNTTADTDDGTDSTTGAGETAEPAPSSSSPEPEPTTSSSPEPDGSGGAGPRASSASNPEESPTPTAGPTSGGNAQHAENGDRAGSPQAHSDQATYGRAQQADRVDATGPREGQITRELSTSLLTLLAVDHPVDVTSRVLPADVVFRVRAESGLVHSRSPVVE